MINKVLIACILNLVILIPIIVNAQIIKDNRLKKAEEEILQSNYTQSISLLNLEIQKNPENPYAYFLRGFAKKELADNLGAFEDFSHSILLHPGYSRSYYHRCILKIDFKDYYSALADINKAISYNVTNTDYYVARGYIYNILKDTTNAIHDFNTAIFLSSDNSNAYLNKSLLEMDMKQYEKALISINKSITLTPFNLSAYTIRGYIKQNSKDTLGAVNDFEFVISKDSTYILAYYNLALYYHNHKNYEKAMLNYNKVLSLNPFHSECYYNRAALFAEKENYVDAINDYDKVIKINPLNIYAYFNRAIVKQNINDYFNALNDVNKVIELYPKFQKAFILRSNIYMHLKNLKAAENDMKFANYLFQINSDTSVLLHSDSLYLLPLLNFRSETQAMDTTLGHVQYKPFKLIFKDIFSLYPVTEINRIIKYNEEIETLNRSKFVNLKINIENTDNSVSIDKIAETKILLDSLTVDFKKDEIINLWQAILSIQLKNYGEALKNLINTNDTSVFAYLSYFLKGNLFVKLNEQYENPEIDNFANNLKKSVDVDANYNNAISAYNESIGKNNKFVYTYYNRAIAKSYVNDISGAVIDYSSCVIFDDKFAEAYYNRGLLYILTGDVSSACFDFSKAGELGISDAYSLLYRYCK